MRTKLLLILLGIVLAAMSTAVQAGTITLDAVQDTYLQERPTSGVNTTFDEQGLLICNTSDKSERENGLYQFDLSGLPGEIVSAYLELYDLGTGGSQGTDFQVDHYILTPQAGATDAQLTVLNSSSNVAFDQDGMHEENATWTTYISASGGYWSESPGATMSLSIDADDTTPQYYASATAGQAGLDLLNANRTGKGYVVLLGYRAAGKRLFDDAEGGHAPRLVVNAIPEPGTLVLLATGCLGLLLCLRRKP